MQYEIRSPFQIWLPCMPIAREVLSFHLSPSQVTGYRQIFTPDGKMIEWVAKLLFKLFNAKKKVLSYRVRQIELCIFLTGHSKSYIGPMLKIYEQITFLKVL